MAWTNLVFTIGQIFTAAQANALNENTRVTRISHKGNTAPALPAAGVRWIDDSNAAMWVENIYTGSFWAPSLFYDTVQREGGMHPQGALWGSIPMVIHNENRTDYAGPPTALKNVLLNAQMVYWQRGNSLGHGGDVSKYTADRWVLARRGNMQVESSRSTEAPAGSPSDFSYQIRVISAQTVFSSGDVISVRQTVEGTTLNRFQFGRPEARYTRFSGWFWGNVTGRLSIGISAVDSPGWTTNIGWADIDVTSTWLFKEFGFIRPTTGNWRAGILGAADFRITIAAASQWITATPSAWVYHGPEVRAASGQLNGVTTAGTIFRFTDIQWESGQVSTPIDVLPPALETMLLARYFWKTFPSGDFPPRNAAGLAGAISVVADNSGRPRTHVRFPAKMRAAPDIVFYSPVLDSDQWYDVTAAAAGQTPVLFHTTDTSLSMNGTTNIAQADHWMFLHLTADAELGPAS